MGSILAMAADSTDLVMTDCTSLRAIPAGGGLLRQLDSSPGSGPCLGFPEVVVQDRTAYWNRNGSLVAVPLDGGVPTVLFEDPRLKGFAVSESLVYYFSFVGLREQGDLIQFDTASGTPIELIGDLPASGPYAEGSRLRQVQGKLVWADNAGLQVVDPGSGFARSSLASPDGIQANYWDVSGSLVAFCGQSGAYVADVNLGTVTSLGVEECSVLTANSAHVFWADSSNYPYSIVVWMAPATGGAAPSAIADVDSVPWVMAANGQFLYMYQAGIREVTYVSLAE